MAKENHTILCDAPDNRVNTRRFTRWNVASLLDVPTDFMLTKDIGACIIYSFTDKRDEDAKNRKLQC